ncbi:bifunctional phosphoribosyl-AMP cyclohydrolase/phosphoribosyl-ATP diphosphatase HisIE [Sphingomonas sediminicola]|uniref:Histidine biosynthesis bifunctional protein HisIE n=1 Tax=Sphingomonas sediminicola TaxID=386874 RepID=A0ABX6TFS2_9SPHN|nr:bifunctional phosphoribosyl-AMP cyclohydrolase/phosphoribosyl-ATP diphosphatase HisIE [Sphingomonas sediminicola]QNP46443.1 bifunctional phosphoribosyl-AMP cyclohydrolase/phosphoribosyl-ATP diphosphatase HisIE [Sphingomonas sediminicola]
MRDRNAPLTAADIGGLAWDKMDGLLPAAIQHRASGRMLMLGYMDVDALGATLESGFVTFFSRSKQRLWMKGETGGNRLRLGSVFADCDDDALLVIAEPEGPTCHLGTRSCFGEQILTGPGWLADLSSIVADRAASGGQSSYSRQLLDSGVERIAQKVGEEGVELALAAVTRDSSGCAEEGADLLYHLAVLLQARDMSWEDLITVLRRRHG